jgi:hypothetical protein
MTLKEKESIMILSKFLAICKNDTDKFSVMRNYLHNKISNLLDHRIKNSQKIIS